MPTPVPIPAFTAGLSLVSFGDELVPVVAPTTTVFDMLDVRDAVDVDFGDIDVLFVELVIMYAGAVDAV